MRAPNIVLIVVDTLRNDFAGGLGSLVSSGFVQYENAIATSSWTLPSHASIFTGELPSVHGVHESLGIYDKRIASLSSDRLRKAESNLLRILAARGYTSFCLTSNPYISQYFGFEFDLNYEFGPFGEIALPYNRDFSERKTMDTALSLLRKHRFGLLTRLAYNKERSAILAHSRRPQLEKGAKYILERLRSTTFVEPFFLFINLMEAHEPYFWNERNLDPLPHAILRRSLRISNWKQAYRRHAELAISRALEIIKIVKKLQDPLIIVTSDHGQLLGEGGRFGHGYYLDDELLRVPLYLRYPASIKPPRKAGHFISLVELHKIIVAVSQDSEARIGSDVVFSESFGSPRDLSRLLTREDAQILSKVYARRVKAFSGQGNIVYDVTHRIIDEISRELSPKEVEHLTDTITSLQVGDTNGPIPLTNDEEAIINQRLKDLGYI